MSSLIIIEQWIDRVKDILWQGPLLILLLGAGLYLSFKLKGLQFRYLGHAIKTTFSGLGKIDDVKGDIKPFQALMTALAGSIGTGNITGIATAIMSGGVGALFWMWIMAAIGMATAYSETLLGVKYRDINKDGEVAGGPMYTLKNGLKMPKLAMTYAILAAISAIGIGCLVQSNSMVNTLVTALDAPDSMRLTIGCILAVLVGMVIIGGVKSIGRVAGILVPIMAVAYITAGLIVLGIHYQEIIPAFKIIITSAFSGQAAVGGFLGSTISIAIQNGSQFGIFANEAGLGTLAIAGSSSKTRSPAKQGMMSLFGVFLATMVVCTITGLVLTVTGVMGTTLHGKIVTGAPLAMIAFSKAHHSFAYIVVIGLNLFAFTTIIAWSYYGEKCIEFIFGLKFSHIYRWIFTLAVVIGAILNLNLVWAAAHLASAVMAVPNLIAVIGLANIVKLETNNYLKGIEK